MRLDSQEKYPLAPSQYIFWALHELFPDSTIGNVAIRLRLRGPLQREALLAGIDELARRFDIWRTTFHIEDASSDGEPHACVHEFAPYPVEEFDLVAEPRADAEAALARLLHDGLHTRFDLTRGPLMRVLLVRLAEQDHVLQFSSHHIALDGVSIHDVIGRQLAACYAAALQNAPLPAPAPVHYADFARAQRRVFSEAERDTLEFWRENLAGAAVALDLPTDHRRPMRRGWRGARLTLAIAAAQRQRLQACATLLGVSLPDLLLSAFYLQLHGYTGQTDLLIGVSNGNRRDPNYRDLFGCLVVTLPVRCNLAEDPSLRDLTQRVRAAKRAAYAHLDPGVDEVLAQLSGAAGSSGSSGYHAVFSYMNDSLHDLRLPGLVVEAERPDPGWSAVDLSMDVHEDRGGLRCTLEYATDLFEAQTAQRYLKHYGNLLEAIVATSSARLSELSPLDEDERRTVLSNFNATSHSYPKEHCLHEIVRERALRCGDALAATDGHHELSYSELLFRSTQLAQRLRAVGAGPGQRVALVLGDPLDAIVAMLATLESGAAYVPIDASLPKGRLVEMLAVIRPVALITKSNWHASLPPFAGVTLRIDQARISKPAADVAHRPEMTPEDPAYVIFTSGSTGVPKGVVVRHRNVVNQLFARLTSYSDTPPLRMLLPYSLAFDAPVAGIYWTLATGGTLILPSADARRDPAAIRRMIARFSVTHLDLVPSLYEELLATGHSHELQSLAMVVLGGEACSAALAERHFEVLPAAALHNEYGPTETTVFSTRYQLHAGRVPDPVPIGRPIANTRCYVLDARGRPLPLGIPGELYIGGAGVAAGYLNDAKRTRERFLADPFAGEPEARMYRTGDLVRLRADGELEFLGRVDRQVKVRGYRIELGEIEAALLRHPAVARAVAVPRQNGSSVDIDAYVTARSPRQPPLLAQLLAALRTDLPAYMVPGHLQLIDRIPLTRAGKIDIERLPNAMASKQRASEAGAGYYVEPRTQTEQALAQIWAQLLGRARIGVLDDFFDLGGHSLLAVRMLSLVAARMGVHVALASFFHRPTISQLAGMLHRDGALAEESLVIPIQTGDRPPFWLPHPVGGHVVFARRLAVHLDREQPLLGIQAQGLDGHREPLRTIEAMAERYIGLMREIQPTGPYFIGGHSLGGLISFEIAQQLRAAGAEIGMLALFDTPGPNYPRRTSLSVRLWDHIRLRNGRLQQWLAPRDARAKDSDSEMSEDGSYDPLRDEEGRCVLMDAIDRVKTFNEIAAKNYRRRTYPDVIHLFRAQRTPTWPGLRFDDMRCGWGPYAQHIEIIPVDCNHQNMMDEPAVTELGEKLQTQLLACQDQMRQRSSSRAILMPARLRSSPGTLAGRRVSR